VQTSPQQRQIPWEGRITLYAAAVVAVTTAVLALPRFGHITPDSTYYASLAGYFRGEVARTDLHTPFAFRWALPWLAARVPAVNPATAIAGCSLVSTISAYLIIGRILSILGARGKAWWLGMAVLVISFPTVNYGAAVLTDSTGFLVLCAAAWALLEKRFLLLGIALALGVWVRESTLVMLPALWLFLLLERDARGMIKAAGITVATLLAVAAARWWFADLPAYFWTPSWERFIGNMTRPISWATVWLTLAPAGAFALKGIYHWKGIPHRTRHYLVALGLPCLALAGYGAVAAFMSGRFCWPLYLALVPLAALGRSHVSTYIPGISDGGVK